MRTEDINKLEPGLYRLHWNDPNRASSLASVGRLSGEGMAWYAVTEAGGVEGGVLRAEGVASCAWSSVRRAERLGEGSPAPRRDSATDEQRAAVTRVAVALDDLNAAFAEAEHLGVRIELERIARSAWGSLRYVMSKSSVEYSVLPFPDGLSRGE